MTNLAICLTMSYMKTTSLTIRIDKNLDELLDKASQQTGKSKSQLAREAIERQLQTIQLEYLRRRIMPFAEARGYLTDEDVFRDVS